MIAFRTYNLNDKNIVFFKKTKEKWGGLSNMAGGYPLFINNILIYSSEALYQAMKFPKFPDIQLQIISQKNPMHSKMIARKNKDLVRIDWDLIKIKIMRWVLLIKLMFNYESFGNLLRETGNKKIVELSSKDKFWGAVLVDKQNMIAKGENVLGRLLMEIRNKTLDKKFNVVASPNISNFNFLGKEIRYVSYINDRRLDLIRSNREESLF